ncbi:hypothetical protein DMB37_35970 [Nocardia sp. CS682]|nr:hypothetical protein DMB37_35970 [Nocardia sp. CS682]
MRERHSVSAIWKAGTRKLCIHVVIEIFGNVRQLLALEWRPLVAAYSSSVVVRDVSNIIAAFGRVVWWRARAGVPC